MNTLKDKALAITIFAVLYFCLSGVATAHCDSVDGPVVRDARAALETGEPGGVLKWVSRDREKEIRDAFARTLEVRGLSHDAKQLADQYFFETLVRVHRAGEGEAFSGLKPAGSVEPGIAAADVALESGSSTRLRKELAEAIDAGIRKRFDLARERRKQADESIDAGREYVLAYVDYVHFVENVHRLAEQGAPHTHSDEHQSDLHHLHGGVQVSLDSLGAHEPKQSTTVDDGAHRQRGSTREGPHDSESLPRAQIPDQQPEMDHLGDQRRLLSPRPSEQQRLGARRQRCVDG